MKRSSKRFIEYYDVKKGRKGLDNKIFLAIVGNVSIEMLDTKKTLLKVRQGYGSG
jgi:hypothetical protein